MGFRAVMNATITSLNADDSSIPPTLQVHSIEDTTGLVVGDNATESACMSYFGIQDIVDEAAAAAAESSGESLQAGDNICVEGYVMDTFCIDRGTFLDNPSLRTLESPEEHSFHCLIDVPSCVTSPFEVLLDPTEPGQLYNRGWRLDADSQKKAIEVAHAVGSCETCVDGNSDTKQQKGFRAVMNATITSLNTDDSSIPPTLQIHSIEDTTGTALNGSDNGNNSACMTYFGMKETGADSSGGGSSSLFDGIGVDSNSNKRNKYMKSALAHGTLMIIGWGLLLPSGTIIAKFFKHRPNGLWFKIHRGIQVLGLSLAFIAWVIALAQFNVFGDIGATNYQHGICGMVVMILGILQPINAVFRPHAPTTNDDGVESSKTTARTTWEYWHKCSGWFAVLLAIPTIGLGTTLLPVPEIQTKFQIGYGAGCGASLLLLIAVIFYDKKTFKKEQEQEEKAIDGQDAATKIDKPL